jgi:hypothetical protein
MLTVLDMCAVHKCFDFVSELAEREQSNRPFAARDRFHRGLAV